MPFLDTTSPEVKAVRACNTVVIKNGVWRGENTDGFGFLQGLKAKQFNVRGKEVAVLGAGGSSRAVIYTLLSEGIRSLIIFNRTLSKAKQLIHDFSRVFPDCLYGAATLEPKNLEALLPGKDLIVNTTSLGLKPNDPSPIREKDLPKAKRSALAYDLVYGGRTEFLKLAKRKGYYLQDGSEMLLHQGARAFEIWTSQKAPLAVMKEALKGVPS